MVLSFADFIDSPPVFESVVVGNTACDLDSVVSSLTRAYHLTCQGICNVIRLVATLDLVMRSKVVVM